MVAVRGGSAVSFRAFVVCEDHTLDQYACVPVVSAALAAVGKPRAVVKAVTSPHLGGISDVERQFEDVAVRYAAISDLVVFALDRDRMDGQGGRRDRLKGLLDRKADLPEAVGAKVDVLLAVEETEVWCLWGQRTRIAASWAEVRTERDPKARYFDPLLEKNDARLPGRGRQRLVSESLANGWDSLTAGCPELKDFESRLRGRVS